MKRRLVGSTETITYEELEEIRTKQLDDILSVVLTLINQSDELADSEARSVLATNISGKLGNLMNVCELQGLLEDDADYIAKLPYDGAGVKFEEDI